MYNPNEYVPNPIEPYDMLDDSEKEYDRATAYETLALICKLGYKIVKADE